MSIEPEFMAADIHPPAVSPDLYEYRPYWKGPDPLTKDGETRFQLWIDDSVRPGLHGYGTLSTLWPLLVDYMERLDSEEEGFLLLSYCGRDYGDGVVMSLDSLRVWCSGPILLQWDAIFISLRPIDG